MKRKRAANRANQSAANHKADAAIRAKYQSAKPSLEQLQADNDYTESLPQSEYLSLMGFAAAVRAIRQQLQLSLADLADLSGIDKAQLSRLESGQIDNPTYATLDRIANSLNKRLKLVLEDAGTAAH